MQETGSVAGTDFDWMAAQPLVVAYVGKNPSVRKGLLQINISLTYTLSYRQNSGLIPQDNYSTILTSILPLYPN